MSPFEGGGGVRYFCCMHGFYHFDFGEAGFIFVFESFLKNFINYYFISEGVQICLYMIFVLHLRTWFSAVIWWFSSYKLHVFLFNINEEDLCSLVHKHITMYIFIIKRGAMQIWITGIWDFPFGILRKIVSFYSCVHQTIQYIWVF